VVRAAVTAFIAASALAASIQAAPAPNVRGTVVGIGSGGASPICPVGEPCDPPQTSAVLLFSRPSRPTVSVRVTGGSFALHLAPGAYAIRVSPSQPGGSVKPSSVRVPRAGVVRLRLVVTQKAVA
jgi:hypothetical protein